MKFISITKSINIRPDWANISGAALKAGTPLDITGAVANSSAAVGILADGAEKSAAEVAVVTEGSIDLAEVTASYGELTDDCIAAIKGIAFIGSDGDPIVPSGGGGVTTLYFSEDDMYESSDFSTDPTFASASAVVLFADAFAMIDANPASVAICIVSSGSGISVPCYARVTSSEIQFTAIGSLSQIGIGQFRVTLTEYSLNENPDGNSAVQATFDSTEN